MAPIRPGKILVNYKIVVLTFSGVQDGYFLRLLSLTSVMIATSIITNVNKSLYVMYISTTPFARLETDGMTVLPAAWLNIFYFQVTALGMLVVYRGCFYTLDSPG